MNDQRGVELSAQVLNLIADVYKFSIYFSGGASPSRMVGVGHVSISCLTFIAHLLSASLHSDYAVLAAAGWYLLAYVIV